MGNSLNIYYYHKSDDYTIDFISRKLIINVKILDIIYDTKKGKFYFGIKNLKSKLFKQIKQKQIQIELTNNFSITLIHGEYSYEITRIGIKSAIIKIRNLLLNTDEHIEKLNFSKKNMTSDTLELYQEMIQNVEDPYLIMLAKINACLFYNNYSNYCSICNIFPILKIIDLMFMHVLGLFPNLKQPNSHLQLIVDSKLQIYTKNSIISLPQDGKECFEYDFYNLYCSLFI